MSFTAQEKPVDGIYWQTTDGFLLHEVEYEVVNGQYFPVVHTGGSGFYWPGVLGAGAAAAGVLYLIRRKTKGPQHRTISTQQRSRRAAAPPNEKKERALMKNKIKAAVSLLLSLLFGARLHGGLRLSRMQLQLKLKS